MKKFEVGKIYGEKAQKYEVTARTNKTITYRSVQHLGRYNERKGEERRTAIKIWDNYEVFFAHDDTITA